jgi:serine/threonine protein phosphatase PrpC
MLNILYKDSLIGKKEENQDACLVKSFGNGDMLLAVADGMGGGEMGAELSWRAIELLDEFFVQEVEYPLQKLKQALFMISDELFTMLNGRKGGTTLCVVYYSQKKLSFINIGDSRVWVCRNQKIINLTLDQNSYEYKKLNNIYTDEEDKRFIHRILGISSSFQIEEMLESEEWSAFGSFELQESDILILSTDGFHDYMGRGLQSMNSITKYKHEIESMLRKIEAVSHDNITAIIAKEI